MAVVVVGGDGSGSRRSSSGSRLQTKNHLKFRLCPRSETLLSQDDTPAGTSHSLRSKAAACPHAMSWLVHVGEPEFLDQHILSSFAFLISILTRRLVCVGKSPDCSTNNANKPTLMKVAVCHKHSSLAYRLCI